MGVQSVPVQHSLDSKQAMYGLAQLGSGRNGRSLDDCHCAHIPHTASLQQ